MSKHIFWPDILGAKIVYMNNYNKLKKYDNCAYIFYNSSEYGRHCGLVFSDLLNLYAVLSMACLILLMEC